MKYASQLKKFILTALFFGLSNAVFSQLSPLTVGTIHPNDSVVIYYDVTINAGAGAQVSNQGTVSGSNFLSFVSDDPDTGPGADATITALNMFPLPVTLYELKATPKGSGIEVSWNVSMESDMVRYEVERSNNGVNFTKVGEVRAVNSMQLYKYIFGDVAPNSGANFYRLRLIDQNAAPKYSLIVKVDLAGKHSAVAIYPNPVFQQAITLQMNDMNRGTYALELYNHAGQLVYTKMIHHEGGSVTRSLSLPAGLAKGVYSVRFRMDNKAFNQLLILQ